MKKLAQNKNVGQPDLAFHGLYKAGALAALAAALIFRRNLDAEWMLIRGSGLVDIGPATSPGAIHELSFYLVRVFTRALIAIPISISAIFLLVWYIQVGVRLWALGASPALKMEWKTGKG